MAGTFQDGSPLRGRYCLVRLVSSDPSSDSYQAVDGTSGTTALVQVVRPAATPTAAARERLLNELGRAQAITVPALLPVLQVGVDDERVVIVRPWPAGVSLAVRLAAGPVPLPWAVSVVRAALQAVRAADAAGLAHPGLTLANIFATDDGQVMVGDGGLLLLPAARVLPALADTDAAGTAPRAPELAPGERATSVAQQFAAAAIVTRLVSGQWPARDPAAPWRWSLPPGLPPALSRAVRRSLALAPHDRGSPDALLQSLAAAGAATGPGKRRVLRWGWLTAAVLVAVVWGAVQIARLTAASAASDVLPEAPAEAAVPVGTPTVAPSRVAALVASAPSTEEVRAQADRCWGVDWPCAIAALSQLSVREPADSALRAQLATAYLNAGLAQAEAGAVAEAEATFAAALAIDPTQALARRAQQVAARYQEGAHAYDLGDWRTAEAAFREVVASGMPFGRARELLAASLVNGGVHAWQDGDYAHATARCAEASQVVGAPAEPCRGALAAAPPSAGRAAPPSRPSPLALAPPPLLTAAPPPIIIVRVPPPRQRTVWLP
ncbi:MAG: hypothetical protein K6U89_01010 [Chloroflexi bacterium]|nr:hypothetical protein [Chloroflexota bacterium]